MDDDYLTNTIKVYDRVAVDYAKQIAGHAPQKQRLNFVSQLKPGDKILEAGCGPGRDSKFFADHGLKVTGVDLSEKLLEIARIAAPTTEFIKQDLRKLDFQDESFAGIWACASLIHLKRNEIPSVLSDFYRFLKPNGLLFVHVKKGEGEVEKIEPSIPGAKRFFTLFSQPEMEKLISDAGFKILESYEYKGSSHYQTGKSMTTLSFFARKI
jgi:ubiquinone/menaquinone biosynthesis C-methylase UbiE